MATVRYWRLRKENTNIVQKQIDIVNGDERDRLIIIEY
jgi:hypothetical protein